MGKFQTTDDVERAAREGVVYPPAGFWLKAGCVAFAALGVVGWFALVFHWLIFR